MMRLMASKKAPKQTKKELRALEILTGLVELYLEEGKPVGSQTLKEHGFDSLSSATLRNYFADLEKMGYLRQPHSSGGRIPTVEGFRFYANTALESPILKPDIEEKLQKIGGVENRDLARFLQKNADLFSEMTGYAVFLSSVRFDHDFIQEIRLVDVDSHRILCVMLTDFGQILTEVLPSAKRFSSLSLKRIEAHLQWKVRGGEQPEGLTAEEESHAQNFYSEMMVRYLVRYSNFSDEDVYRTGFSELLAYPEFQDPIALTTGLSLFENTSQMRRLLADATQAKELRFWIDRDLAPYSSTAVGCTVVTTPYKIGGAFAGSLALLGPLRMPYKQVFGALQGFSDSLSQSLTKSLVKFKLSFRKPHSDTPYIESEERMIVDKTSLKLLERKEI
ncbi:MAG: Heat-inducible transcription repressor HrcA [Chlamydiae bacterium]|nr:Heat-inducible transcription repressor HrcA [Chlamydiota bacterium]